MSDFFRDLAKRIGNETRVMDDAKSSGELTGWIDTGSYVLNAQVSGSIYGGIPDNRVTGLAGSEGTGKTYYAMSLAGAFQRDHDGGVMWCDTEAASTKEMMTERGIDASRVLVSEPEYIQQFATRTKNFLDTYHGTEGDKPRMMIVLDSLGNIPSKKELEDMETGHEVRDMTRPQVIRSAFRVLTPRAARAGVPMIVTNHTYQGIGTYAVTEMSGGGGLKYAASTILYLSKLKDIYVDRDRGTIIKSIAAKSRFTRERTEVRTRLLFQGGLDRYFGLVELGVETGILEKNAGRIVMPDGSKHFEKSINLDPERFWNKELLDRLEEAGREWFRYDSTTASTGENDDDDTSG